MKKDCELCGREARLYCESDQASLCSECDGKVHGANFLVAKHCRKLLCQVCQSPTSWTASGAKLGEAVSVCENCVVDKDRRGRFDEIEGSGESQAVSTSVEEDDGGTDYGHTDSELEDEEEKDCENQVVPLSGDTTSTPSPQPPPPVLTSSSSEGDISSEIVGGCARIKRRRADNTDLNSVHDEINHSPSEAAGFRDVCGQSSSKSTTVLGFPKRFRTINDE